MKGSVHKDNKSERWFINIYWEGKRYRFYKHPITGDRFDTQPSAEKQLNRIRIEVDDGYFNPKDWNFGNPLLLDTYAQKWLESIEVSKKTLQGYRSAVNNYILPFFGKKNIRVIRHDDIVQFHKWVAKSDKGKYNVVGVLKAMLRYAWRNEDIPKVPPFPKLSFALPEIEYLSMEEQALILSAIPERDRPIFEFMMEYGVRPGEARALQKDCIVDGDVTIKRAFSDFDLRETTKSGAIRVYAITPYMAGILKTLPLNVSPFVFIKESGLPYSGHNLNTIWHKAGEETGIKIKLYNGVRHSLGCQLLDMGYEMDLVRQQLGHTKSEMTRRYAKRSSATLSKMLEGRRGEVIEVKKADVQ